MPNLFHLVLVTSEIALNVHIDFLHGMTEMQILFQEN